MARDAVATMGGLLPEDASGRDAVHVAVFSAISSVKLFPGQDVGAISDGDGRDVAVAPMGVPPIGIVDPFLRSAAMPGERFWVYLYPRTITSLSHRWGHPAFGEEDQKYERPAARVASPADIRQDAEEELRRICDTWDGISYHDFLAEAKSGRWWGEEYIHVSGHDAHGDIPDRAWDLAEIILDRKLPGEKPKYFSCSC